MLIGIADIPKNKREIHYYVVCFKSNECRYMFFSLLDNYIYTVKTLMTGLCK